MCYANGEGLEKDVIQAYKCLNIAAPVIPEAAKERNSLEKTMTKEQISEAQRLSSEFKPVIPDTPPSPPETSTSGTNAPQQSQPTQQSQPAPQSLNIRWW